MRLRSGGPLRRAVRFAARWTLLWAWCLLAPRAAQAHPIEARKGTLNLLDRAAYLVVSLPVSALDNVDDDGDGALSPAELEAHAGAIRAQVIAGVQLLGPDGALPLHLLMLDETPPEDSPGRASRHVVAMGWFDLGGASAAQAPDGPALREGLRMRFRLFGKDSAQRELNLTITRQQDVQWVRFTPERPEHRVLPSSVTLLADYARIGAEHVLQGPDHLLFLLVVLATGWGWRTLLAALSCFTAGHALTLALCVWAGWSVPAGVVEPAIAATIVGMVAFDLWSRRQARAGATAQRLALVFLCALVHGLGFAGALTELTRWPAGSAQMAGALIGFNLGIEAAQIAVALLAGAAVQVLRAVVGQGAHRWASNAASATALVAGTWWFLERLGLQP